MEKHFIGIDLGGTSVKIGLVANGQVLARHRIDAFSTGGLRKRLPVLQAAINALLAVNTVKREDLGGIGLAFAGLVNSATSRVIGTNKKYDDAMDVDLTAWVEENWKTRFFMDNDTRMATVGEWKYGAGKGTDDMVMMTIGTGIGTSAIIEGKILRGRHHQAGCLGGHFTIQYDQGRDCTCNNKGCGEAYGGTLSAKEMAKEDNKVYEKSLLAKADTIDLAAVFAAAEKGDALAVKIRQTCMDAWTATLINLIHAYDPEVAVIGGGVMKQPEFILQHLERTVMPRLWRSWGDVRILASEQGDDAAILGVVHCLNESI